MRHRYHRALYVGAALLGAHWAAGFVFLVYWTALAMREQGVAAFSLLQEGMPIFMRSLVWEFYVF